MTRKGGRPKLSNIGVCKVSIAAVRQVADHKSCMVSQVLFGEQIEIVSKKKNWYKIKCSWDGTIGWVDPRQFRVIREKELAKHKVESRAFALDHLAGLNSENATFPICIGSNLYDCDGINVRLAFGLYQYHGQIVHLDQSRNSQKLLINIAKRYLHSPYLYGGRSILGVDGEGLVQVIYKMIGLNLPRTALEQSKIGADIGFHSQAQIGDLAFFDQGGLINKVGIIIGESQIVHVHGRVRIDVLDQQGIFDTQSKRYLSTLRSIRRVTELT